MIPFSPPKIYQELIDEVEDTLRSGWITTGPKTKQLEKDVTSFVGCKSTLCLNSATAGLEIMLRWFGVGEGDEVIVPAYTYSATANVVLHCGAKPIMVDVGNDFNIAVDQIKSAITERTKVIMPVDFAGWPCDYDEIMDLVKDAAVQSRFTAHNDVQKKLGRILVLADAAHSIGAKYKDKKTGALADVSVFSFHAVKNLTTAEGGAVCLNLPDEFDCEEVYRYLCIITLHGQTKDALSKSKGGNWKYDIIEAGYKCNMTDIQASLGLVELRRYEKETLTRRDDIVRRYLEGFKGEQHMILPEVKSTQKTSSFHLFPIRLKNFTEEQRDNVVAEMYNRGVSVNVHFIPLPLLTLYKNLGYQMEDFPNTYQNFKGEISLPVYFDLQNDQVEEIIEKFKVVVNEIAVS